MPGIYQKLDVYKRQEIDCASVQGAPAAGEEAGLEEMCIRDSP